MLRYCIDLQLVCLCVSLQTLDFAYAIQTLVIIGLIRPSRQDYDAVLYTRNDEEVRRRCGMLEVLGSIRAEMSA
jgi:hypothetical protein